MFFTNDKKKARLSFLYLDLTENTESVMCSLDLALHLHCAQ